MSISRVGVNIQTCPDGHHCQNGSQCVQNPYDETAYYCDCQESVFEARYEGLYCEHKADVFCVRKGIHQHAFCTNGGTCIEYVGIDEAHVGCDCPSQYEGTYCQFVKGTKPDGWPFTTEVPSIDRGISGSTAGIVIGSIVFCLVVIVIGLSMLFKRWSSPSYVSRDSKGRGLELGQRGKNEAVSLSLDPDGSALPSPTHSHATGKDLYLDADGGEMPYPVESKDTISPSLTNTKDSDVDVSNHDNETDEEILVTIT